MGLPRYMASARVDDPDRTVWLANALASTFSHDQQGTTLLLQVGRVSAVASDLAGRLAKLGRHPLALIVKDRLQAQSDFSVAKLAGASTVWIFADDLFKAFLTIFATPLAFALRLKASDGVPVVGIGSAAFALGGLLVANRVCHHAQYDLLSGLGVAARVLLDGGAGRGEVDGLIARGAVRTLPGLLGLDLGVAGGVRVTGGRVESIGSEPIQLFGGGDNGSVVVLSLEPGMFFTIAPPPFAPFERGQLPPAALRPLVPEPPPPSRAPALEAESHTLPGSGRRCPVCRQIHPDKPKLELDA